MTDVGPSAGPDTKSAAPQPISGTDSSTDVAAALARYQQAWADGDVDAIVAMTPPDGVYEASFGPHPWGERYVGPDEIRAALVRMGVGESGRARHVYEDTHVIGDAAFAHWKNVEDRPEGPVVTLHGADFYRLRDGMVVAKIAYRKNVST
jgi:ketosteroid isomerase-like protein